MTHTDGDNTPNSQHNTFATRNTDGSSDDSDDSYKQAYSVSTALIYVGWISIAIGTFFILGIGNKEFIIAPIGILSGLSTLAISFILQATLDNAKNSSKILKIMESRVDIKLL